MSDESAVERVRRIKRENENALLGKANVIGVGIGYRQRAARRTDEVALLVFVHKKVPADQLSARDLIPTEIDGIAVDVLEVGRLSSEGV